MASQTVYTSGGRKYTKDASGNRTYVDNVSSSSSRSSGSTSSGSSSSSTPTKTSNSNLIADSSGTPTRYSSGGQVYYKDKSGNKIDVNSGKVIQQQTSTPTKTTINKVSSTPSKTGLYVEITDEGVQDTIYARDQTGKIVKTDYTATEELKTQVKTGTIPTTRGYSVTPSRPTPTQTPTTPSLPEDRVSNKKLYQTKGGVTTQAPFFSVEGQKQRFGSMFTVLNPFSSQKVFFNPTMTDVTIPTKAAVATTEVLGGLYLGGLAFGAVAAKGTAATAATQAAALKAALGTRAGIFTTGLVSSIAVGEGARLGTEGIGYLAAPKEQKEIMKLSNFDRAIKAAYGSEKEAVGSQTWYKRLAYEIPIVSIWTGDKKAFEEGARNYYKSQGYTGNRLETAVKTAVRQRTVSEVGQGAGFLTSSAASEIIGQKLVTKSFEKLAREGIIISKSKSFSKLFSTGFKSIAPAGLIEGATQELIQQRGRRQDTDIKNIALMGGFGAASAGLIGGTIMGTSVSKPAISKTLEIGSYLADPYEKIGDLTAAGVEKAAQKTLKLPVSTPVIFETFSPTDTLKVGTKTTTSTKTSKKGTQGILSFSPFTLSTAPAQTQKFSGVITPTDTLINTLVKTPTPSKSSPNVPINPFVNVNIPTNTPKNTPIGVFADTPINILPNTPVNTPAQTPTNIFTDTPVNTPIPISIPVSIPVNTPILRLPPPMPLPFNLDAGSGSAGTAKRKRNTFVDELAQSQKLLNQMSGLMFSDPLAPMSKPKKSKRKKRK